MSGALSTAKPACSTRGLCKVLMRSSSRSTAEPNFRLSLICAVVDRSSSTQINDSLKFGSAVLRELERINTLHKPRVEQAGFAVLKAPDIPSILVETAFISNPEEEARLKDERYQQSMASAIVGGIKRYFEANPPVARRPVG